MSAAPLRPAVFLDRDGTLNEPVVREGLPYAPETAAEFRLFAGVPEACHALSAAGFVLVVTTNQPEVGRGTVAQGTVEKIHARLRHLVPEIVRIEVSYEPGRGEISRRRKPAPGMVFDAANALGLDLSRSWMIGDRWRDIDCARNAKVRSIFIDLGYREALHSPPDFTVKNFPDAAAVVLAQSRA